VSQRLDYNQIAPAGVKALGGVYGYIMQCGLPAVLVDLVYLRVSQINNCAYCLDMHTRDLIKKGEKIEKLALVQASAEAGNVFDERERAALAWAETVTAYGKSGNRGMIEWDLFERCFCYAPPWGSRDAMFSPARPETAVARSRSLAARSALTMFESSALRTGLLAVNSVSCRRSHLARVPRLRATMSTGLARPL
jgi:AhpD family alkylhydroperoxidase